MWWNAYTTLMTELSIFFNLLWFCLFNEYFTGVLLFQYHFNSLLLTFITGVYSETHCSNGSRFLETSYLTFIAIQITGCHVMRDLGVENLGEDYKKSYICM